MKRLLPLLLLLALSASASGCYSKATAYDAKFTVAYASGLDFDNFVKPIAPGAKLDVVIFANGTEEKLVITGAKSSKPGVLAVDSIRGENTLVLRGIAPGVADIEVTARDGSGKTLVDRVYLHVDKPTVHGISHSCTEEPEAIYVAGSDLWLYHGLATSDGRPVIGYGYVPLRIEPAAALDLVAQPQGAAAYRYRAPRPNAKITVRSTVDDGALSLRVVNRGDLKTATLECGGECTTVEGYSRYVFAHVTAGETPVCSQNALTKARSLTPAICSVSAKLDDDDGTDSNHEQLAEVKGIKFGICKFEVTLPELDGGKGITLTGEAKIGRLEFPGGGRVADTAAPAEERRSLVKTIFSTSWLIGLGWLAPNVIIVACWLWMRRRKR